MRFANRIKPFVAGCFALTCALLGGAGPAAIAQALDKAEPAAAAQSNQPPPLAPQPLAPGDVIVTGFSGTKLAGDGGIAPGVNPLDKTVINTEAASLRAFGIETIGGTPAGQLLNPQVKFEVKAADIGQVFGVALDDGATSPTLFTAATAAFGLQIVAGAPDADGTPVRLKAGAPDAKFMVGQFGGLPGAGPGTIYKIDVATGAATVFANTDAGGVANSGAGLAGPALDAKSRSLYAADLDTGQIHRFSLDGGGASTAIFDHGDKGLTAAGKAAVADDGKRLDLASPTFRPDDPATWSLTSPERRVTALAVRDGRLYYAVAAGPEVWSVTANADGTFGADARIETPIVTEKPATITSIAFDKDGKLVVALRGAQKSPFDFSKFIEPESGRVVRFSPAAHGETTPGARWGPAFEEFSVGGTGGNMAASGGVAFGHAFAADGSIDLAQCNGTLIVSGDALSKPGSDEEVAHGLQFNAATLAKPANTPPSQSVFIDFDGRLGNVNQRGHVGTALGITDCSGAAGGPPVEGPPVAEGGPPVEEGGPPVAGGGGGGPPVAGAEGPPVEDAPPVEDGPPVEEAAVDPNAPNMAIKKTQQCSVDNPANPTKATCTYNIALENTGSSPFLMPISVITDRVSGATPQITPSPGVSAKSILPDGLAFPLSKPSLVPPGQPSPGLPVNMTFDVPPGGTTIENCATLALPPPRDTPFPQTLAEKAKARAEFSPKIGEISKTADGGSTQGCKRVDKDTKFCQWRVNIDNRSFSEFKGTKLALTLSEPPIGSVGTFRSFENPPFPLPNTTTDNKTFDVTADVEDAGQQVVVTGIFPANKPDPELTATVKEFGTPTVPLDVELKAGLQQASVDSNPADNTSCIAFDTNNPEDQGTPTNEPTQGEPIADGPPVVDDVAPDVADAPPLPGAGNLQVSKKVVNCQRTSATDGSCLFEIALNNPGPDPFPLSSVTLNDTFTSVKPKELPLLGTQFPGAQPTETGFEVVADPDAARQNLPPNVPLKTTLTAKFDVPPEGLDGENCATISFVSPGSDVPPVFTPDDILKDGNLPQGPPKQGMDRGVKILGDPVCVTRGGVKDCAWEVTVENNGSVPFPLAFQFETGIPNNQVTSAASAFVSGGSRRSGNLTIFESAVPVDPGSSKVVVVQATVPNSDTPVSATARTVQSVLPTAPPAGPDVDPANDATAPAEAGTDASQPIPGSEVFKGDTVASDNKDCKPFSFPPKDAPQTKFNITKSPLGPTCGKGEERQEWRCGWKVIITNAGTAPFTGPIVFTDETTFATTTNIVSGGGNVCEANGGAASQSRRCEAKATDLQPNATIELSLDTSIPFSAVPVNTQPGGCQITNTVQIVSPSGSGAAPSALAMATLEPGENKGGQIPCDPPSLTLSKTAKTCTASGDGFDCSFAIVVTSTGPDPFQNGVIDIVEAVPPGTTLTTASQGWSCTPAGGLFHCHHGAVTLAVNAQLKLDVLVRVPKSAIGPGKCEIKNEAQIVEIGRANTSSAGRYKASATAKIDSPECAENTSAPPKRQCLTGYVGDYPDCCKPPLRFNPAAKRCVMPEVTCFGGMTLVSSSGKCVCPDGKSYDPQRGLCASAPTRACLPGWSGAYYSGGQCYARTASVTGTPPRGGSDGTIDDNPVRCPDGSIKKRGEACSSRQNEPLRGGVNNARSDPLPRCKGSLPVGNFPNCCPIGTTFLKGVCRRPNEPKITGGTNNTVTQVDPPKCPKNTKTIRNGKSIRCIPIASVGGGGGSNKCPASRPVGKPPYCCPSGTRYANGVCSSSSTAGKGTGNNNKGLTGGTNNAVNSPVPCPAGMHGTPPNCKKNIRRIGRRMKCPAGQVGSPPNCVVPDKRIDYGAFSGQGKPPVDKGAPK
jgi:sugar lactone lactonase YvrE